MLFAETTDSAPWPLLLDRLDVDELLRLLVLDEESVLVLELETLDGDEVLDELKEEADGSEDSELALLVLLLDSDEAVLVELDERVLAEDAVLVLELLRDDSVEVLDDDRLLSEDSDDAEEADEVLDELSVLVELLDASDCVLAELAVDVELLLRLEAVLVLDEESELALEVELLERLEAELVDDELSDEGDDELLSSSELSLRYSPMS